MVYTFVIVSMVQLKALLQVLSPVVSLAIYGFFYLQDATIDELFLLLEEKTGVPPREARLIHAGKELEQGKGKRISDYPSILHGSNLFMVMRLLGGVWCLYIHNVCILYRWSVCVCVCVCVV